MIPYGATFSRGISFICADEATSGAMEFRKVYKVYAA